MSLNKKIYISSLYNIYGKLLTKKQQSIMEDYFFHDLTLAEISQIYKITRQAVLDSVNKSSKILENYEETLQVFKKNNLIKELLKSVKLDKENKELINAISNI